MTITLLDVDDDEHCAAAHSAIVASQGAGRPWFEPESVEEAIADWRHVDKAEPKMIWVAQDADGVAGAGTLWLPMEDNTSFGWFDVQVHPDRRRRGHGSALLREIVSSAQAAGRRQLIVELTVPSLDPGHPYRQFVHRHGFALSNTEIVRHLELPVAGGLLDRLEAESRPHWEGRYRIETYVDGVPEALRESVCGVMNQLAVDAPTGDIEFEPESFTPVRYAEQLELEREQKRVRLTTVAVDPVSGDVVAYTDLVLPSGAPSTVWQWGTLVRRDHRGHRLGTAVKIENLRRLQADHPGRGRVVTSNDETNRHMVAINEALGFRIVEFHPTYLRNV